MHETNSKDAAPLAGARLSRNKEPGKSDFQRVCLSVPLTRYLLAGAFVQVTIHEFP
jgi:hypothetical protein